MTAYRLAAIRAAPLCLFLLQKPLDAMRFDEFEVFDHTQMVLIPVALIEGFQPIAGKICAFIAKPDKSFPKQVALFFHEGTVLTAWQTAGAVCLTKPLLIQVVFHRQITDTYTAVHPTGSNEFLLHIQSSPHLNLFTYNIIYSAYLNIPPHSPRCHRKYQKLCRYILCGHYDCRQSGRCSKT